MTDFTQNLVKNMLELNGRVIDSSYSSWSYIDGLVREAVLRNGYYDDDLRTTVVYGVDLLSAYPAIRRKRFDVDAAISRYKDRHRQHDPLTGKVYEVTLTLYQERDDEAYVVNTFDNTDADGASKKQYYVTADLDDAMRQYDAFIEEFVQAS